MKIQTRRDTASTWETVNPILDVGELGYAWDSGIIKIGDGVTSWINLPGTRMGNNKLIYQNGFSSLSGLLACRVTPTVSSGQLGISANVNGQVHGVVDSNKTFASPDHYTELVVENAASGSWVGPVCRASQAVGTSNLYGVVGGISSGSTFRIWTRSADYNTTSGDPSAISLASAAGTAVAGDVLRLEVKDDTARLFKNGVRVLVVSHPQIGACTGTSPGSILYGTASKVSSLKAAEL